MEYELNDENLKMLADDKKQKKTSDRKTEKLAQLAFDRNGIIIDGLDNCPEDMEALKEINAMRQHFKDQLAENKPITASILATLKGRSIYGPYKIGDVMLFFMEQEKGVPEKDNYTCQVISFKMQTCTERHLPELEEEYTFVRMAGNITPLLKRKIVSNRK